MCTTDKFIRVALAIIVGFLYYSNTISGTVAVILGVFAIIFVLTSFISYCSLYVPLGLNACANTDNK